MSASGGSMWPLRFIILGCFLPITLSNEAKESPSIGIVGGGIGGTSTAYFLRQLFGDDAKIDIFEKRQVGGRLATISIGNQQFEAGGAVIHPKNMYMVNFTKLLGLEHVNGDMGSFGIFDGSSMRITSNKYRVVTLAKLFWRYGMDIYNIDNWINEKLLAKFMRIYDIQRAGHAYTTVPDLIGAMDSAFLSYMKKSIKFVMRTAGFGDAFIDEMVMGALRTNYGQSTEIPGFVGAVSLAGVQPGLWAVKGGNKQVPEKLVTEAKAQVIQGTVMSVQLLQYQDKTYRVEYVDAEKKEQHRDYDIVIIATPLHDEMSDIDFEDFPSPIENFPQHYHKLTSTFVDGTPNSKYFGVDNPEDLSEEILTCNDTILVNSCGKKTDVLGSPAQVYKVFSNSPPKEDDIKQMFTSKKDIRMFSMMAYPDYSTVGEELPPFVLHDQLYYVNAIELAASAMEMSSIAGKNVALLAYNHWHGSLEKIDEPYADSTSETEKTEL
ncbi:prenylcysteine oxidase 1-like [Ostrea edulis]|uniref:prenylcysteine oxidase 1-like n=1 Tax=Ostrea edulis TaxID=37623 RepID=UPI0020957543|nr:prenylcysteine oxidase 1-like [Ostrea edulis]